MQFLKNLTYWLNYWLSDQLTVRTDFIGPLMHKCNQNIQLAIRVFSIKVVAFSAHKCSNFYKIIARYRTNSYSYYIAFSRCLWVKFCKNWKIYLFYMCYGYVILKLKLKFNIFEYFILFIFLVVMPSQWRVLNILLTWCLLKRLHLEVLLLVISWSNKASKWVQRFMNISYIFSTINSGFVLKYKSSWKIKIKRNI